VECVCPATCSWGINILTLDCRGFGESGGDRFDKLPQEEAAQVIGEKWPGDIDHQLLEKCQTLAASRIGRNSRFRFKNKLMSLDATVLDLCASVFDWAQLYMKQMEQSEQDSRLRCASSRPRSLLLYISYYN
jgi:hypothetical protein